MSGADSHQRDDRSVSQPVIREALRPVLDPELDESIVDLGYIDEIVIEPTPSADRSAVTVRFTLPTAWCSPAFAWMMASDAHEAVSTLSGVETTEIILQDHMHEDEITTGINTGQPFEAVFPDADGGLEAVRASLDHKARLARQFDAVDALLKAGMTPGQIVSLTPSDITDSSGDRTHIYLQDGSFAVSAPTEPLTEYLEMANEEGCLTGDDEPLFRTPKGEPVSIEIFEQLHRRNRSAKVNVNGQGTVCEALNESRRKALGRSDD
ncbi:iron-sulfur cluster assembly protein [Halorubraceae archaeon YAN]|nr:iron-sulfur cluster assembly protein [Halorubraceae archaeon YAN]